MLLDIYNKREKQILGAFAVKYFSDNYNIRDKSINELLMHLLNLGIAKDLAKWDEEGLNISITGRGDELPEKLIKKIPENIYNDFYELIDLVIEIGIVDLYGDDTDLPFKFLNQSIDILEKHNIRFEIPTLLIREKGNKSKTWGNPIGLEKYNFFKKLLLRGNGSN